MVKFNSMHKLMAKIKPNQKVQFVLFGFRAYLALRLDRSPLSHS